jgi:hypothetical protein
MAWVRRQWMLAGRLGRFADQRSAMAVTRSDEARILGSRRSVLDLTGGDVDHQLGGLAEIAGALATVLGHA